MGQRPETINVNFESRVCKSQSFFDDDDDDDDDVIITTTTIIMIIKTNQNQLFCIF